MPTPKTVRITIDLDQELHREIKRWAVDEDAKLAEVSRALFRRLLEHPPTAAAVRRELEEGKGRKV